MSSLFLIYLCQVMFLFWHGTHVAEYHLLQVEDRLQLHFTIDTHELSHYKLKGDCDVKLMPAFCTAKYVLRHTKVYLNGKEVPLEYTSSNTANNHMQILFEGGIETDSIQELRVKVTNFLEFEPEFKNRIQLDLGAGKFAGSYLLVKGREEIMLK